MNKVKVLIVEDELIIAANLRQILLDLGYAVTALATDDKETYAAIAAERPDIVLLDIQLARGVSGIEIGRALRARYGLPFVYVTSHADAATVSQAKATVPNGYLVKPFDRGDVYAAIEVALVNFVRQAVPAATAEGGLPIAEHLVVKDGRRMIKLRVSEILFVQADGNYLEIRLPDRKYLVRATLKSFLTQLPADRFCKVHKSWVVNLAHAHLLEKDQLHVGDFIVPVYRNYLDTVRVRMSQG